MVNAQRLREVRALLRETDTDLRDMEGIACESDIDLIECGALMTEIATLARGNVRLMEAEVVRRMAPNQDILAHDYGKATRTWKNSYDPKADEIAKVIPASDLGYLEHIPEETVTVPAHWKVKNTTAFKNYVAKLGDTPLGKRLTELMGKKETFDKVVFDYSDLEGWQETVDQLTKETVA